LMCSGRIDPQFVLKALSEGADGVLITGCHPGDCHYVEQNYKTMRRFALLKKTLKQMGLEDNRVRLVWASAAEGAILAEEINKFVADVRALGPLNWKQTATATRVVAYTQAPVPAAA
jgi:F420-non-reducing hydrogenase iron-sulfur subunit